MSEKPWEVWDEDLVNTLEQAWGPPTKGKKTNHQELIKTVGKLISGGSVLDVGCGLGHLYEVIKDNVKTYLGVDSSPVMIMRARSYFGKELFIVGDAYDLSSLPSADTVICLDVVKHIPETWPVLTQVWSKARNFVILVTNVGSKQRIWRNSQEEGKYLIYRVETINNLMNLFKKLPNIGKIEQTTFNDKNGSTIFKLEKIV